MPKKQSPHTVSRQAVVDERRRHIARMRLQGFTQREIEGALPKAKIVNPRGGKAWSLGTINGDLQAIHEEWVKEATRDIGEHKAQILAELEEVKRVAWAQNDLQAVLRAIDKEAKILGIEAPTVLEHTGEGGIHIYLPDNGRGTADDGTAGE